MMLDYRRRVSVGQNWGVDGILVNWSVWHRLSPLALSTLTAVAGHAADPRVAQLMCAVYSPCPPVAGEAASVPLTVPALALTARATWRERLCPSLLRTLASKRLPFSARIFPVRPQE